MASFLNKLEYLSNKKVCKLLGIKKLNTTSHHPECNGAVESLTVPLKKMLRKQVAEHGTQWDRYIHGVVWVYCNTPDSSTRENPPTCYLVWIVILQQRVPFCHLNLTGTLKYQTEFVATLSLTRALALKCNQKSQQQYNQLLDKKATTPKFSIGDWVLVYFPQDKTGKDHKLSQPWHGPYRIVSHNDADVTVVKIYFPDDPQIQIHQSESRCVLTCFLKDFTSMARKDVDLATHQRR